MAEAANVLYFPDTTSQQLELHAGVWSTDAYLESPTSDRPNLHVVPDYSPVEVLPDQYTEQLEISIDELALQRAKRLAKETGRLLPHAVRVQDLAEESEVQADFARGLGSIAVGGVVEKPSEQARDSTVSIVDQLKWAAKGDRAAINENASLALVEAILSEGVNEVRIKRDQKGELAQSGHRLYDVHKNTLAMRPGEHPELHETTRAEALGLSTMEMLDDQGYFDAGYVWVAPRMVPQGVPAAALRDYGYFENLAVSWGIVWKEADGTFAMRTLFTAGADPQAHEERDDREMTAAELDDMVEQRLTRRHDIRAISAMYRDRGLPIPEDTAGFQRGFITHKSQFVHEAEYDVDIAEEYDNQLGSDFFLGRRASRRNYLEQSRQSIRNMRNLDKKRDAVVDELLESGIADNYDPMVAAKLLAKIARKHAIDYVIDHPEVDASPLGLAAKKMRENYQYYTAVGDHRAAQQMRTAIHKVSRANMCGFGDKRDESGNLISDDANSKDSEKGNDPKHIRCIKCKENVLFKDVVKPDCWQCPKCNHKVDICSGKVLREGNGRLVRTVKKLGGFAKRLSGKTKGPSPKKLKG